MEELALKIKELKQIQPEKDWVKSTKAYILGEVGDSPAPVIDLGRLRNRAFLFGPVLVVLGITLIFFYNNIVSLKTASLDAEVLEAIALNLTSVQTNLLRAAADLERVEEPSKVVKVKDAVISTIISGEKVAQGVKEIVEGSGREGKSPAVLAALIEMEQALEGMKEAYVQKQKKLAEQLIIELEGKSLTAEQAALLEEAKEEYGEGRFAEALIKAIEVSQPH